MKVLIVGAGPGRIHRRLLPGQGRHRRHGAGKDQLPAREGLRRRPHAARGPRDPEARACRTAEADGWRRNKGLRLIAGGRTIEVPWPELSDFPQYGLIRTRLGFDEELARHAQAAGAVVLERHSVTEALRADAGRVTGVRAALLDEAGRKTGETRDFIADVVLAADGNSTRTAVSLGIAEARRPAARRGRAHLLHPPAARRRLDGRLAGASRPRTASCCPATAGCSASATAPPTWAWAS